MQYLGPTGACDACSHCTATAWELSVLDHSHAATPQRVTRASCAQLLRSDFCAWRRLLLICWKLLIGVCVRDGLAASVCVYRTSVLLLLPLSFVLGVGAPSLSLVGFIFVIKAVRRGSLSFSLFVVASAACVYETGLLLALLVCACCTSAASCFR